MRECGKTDNNGNGYSMRILAKVGIENIKVDHEDKGETDET